MSSKRLVSTAAICLLLAAGTTACGGNDDSGTGAAAKAAAVPTLDTEKLSAEEIEKHAKDALTGATSLKVKGEAKTDEGTMKIDLALDTKGQCVGSLAMPGMGGFEVVNDGNQAWIKPDAKFWETFGGKDGAKAAELFKGRWLSGVNSDPKAKQLTEVCNLKSFTKEIAGDDGSKVTKGTAGTVDGQKTFSLKSVDKDGEESLIHVLTEGKFYPVRIDHPKGESTGQMNFTDFDKPITITPPPAAEVIDISKFKSQFPSAV